MTTPTYHPGDRVRVRAETAGKWRDRDLLLRIRRRVVAEVQGVVGADLPEPYRSYKVRFDAIPKNDVVVEKIIEAPDLEPAP
jgi:hypothetical protein